MEAKDILLIVVMVAAAGFSIYRKYIKKSEAKPGVKRTNEMSASSDYEPYSGK